MIISTGEGLYRQQTTPNSPKHQGRPCCYSVSVQPASAECPAPHRTANSTVLEFWERSALNECVCLAELRARVHHTGCLVSAAFPPFPKVICSLYILQLSLVILKKNKLYNVNVQENGRRDKQRLIPNLGGLLPPSCNKTKPCSRTSTNPAFICTTGCKAGWGAAELREVRCPHSRAGTARTLPLSLPLSLLPAAHGARPGRARPCRRNHQAHSSCPT